MAVSSFFDSFPKIKYDINNTSTFQAGSHEVVTNIFFRLGVIQNALNNISSYFVYDIEDGDTPELLAERFYNDPGAAWMILLANNIVDAQHEWPLDYSSFQQFVADKYGSVELSQTTAHHYEKVIERRNTRTDVVNETRFIINEDIITDDPLSVPYDYYQSLATGGAYYSSDTYDIGDDSIEVTVRGEEVSCYEYENRKNDDRRSIKVIKAEYYVQIMDEFRYLTGQKPDYIRKLF